MAKLGEAVVHIRANLKPLKAGLKAARAAVTSAMRAISSVIRKVMHTITRTLKWAALGFAGLSAAAVKFGMDAEESENLFEVAMANMAKATRKWSDELSNALGLNAYNVRKVVSTLNVMLKSMGLAAPKAASMSQELTKLTYDMASFYNLKPDDVFLKLQAAITGETEPLKRLGILVNETTIKTYALNAGLIQEGQQLTEVQKVFARYIAIMAQTKDAQGDLERTSGSLTNVLRSLRAMIKEVAIVYGQALMPSIKKNAIAMRNWLKENKQLVMAWAEKVAAVIIFVKDIFWDFANFIRYDFNNKMAESLAYTIKIFKAFGKVLADVGKRIGQEFALAIGKQVKVFAEKPGVMRKIGLAVAAPVLTPIVKAAVAAQKNLAKPSESFKALMKTIRDELPAKLKKDTDASWAKLLALLADIDTRDQQVANNARKGIAGAGAGAPAAAGGGGIGFVGIKEAWKTFIGGMKSPMVKAQDNTTKAVKEVKGDTKQMVATLKMLDRKFFHVGTYGP